MVFVNSWLIGETGLQTLDETPWCMNHASLHASDDAVLLARKEKYKLFLTTNRFISRYPGSGLILNLSRMLLGIDIPNVQQIILVRPPNKEHSIVQVYCEVFTSLSSVIFNEDLVNRRWAGQVESLHLGPGLGHFSTFSSTLRCCCASTF